MIAIVQAANAATADVWDDQPVGGIAVAMDSDAAVPASETMAIAANAGVPAAKAFSAGHGPRCGDSEPTTSENSSEPPTEPAPTVVG